VKSVVRVKTLAKPHKTSMALFSGLVAGSGLQAIYRPLVPELRQQQTPARSGCGYPSHSAAAFAPRAFADHQQSAVALQNLPRPRRPGLSLAKPSVQMDQG
jgi:hypothetical protein